MNTLVISRIIIGWIMAISIFIGCTITKEGTIDKFYRIGPNENLIILGITIDTMGKYMCLVLYALVNTVIRNMNHNIISPWITLNIQDDREEAKEKKKLLNKKMAYEISLSSTFYTWFDWLIYINLLLAQIDMVIIECLTDILVTVGITYVYINNIPLYFFDNTNTNDISGSNQTIHEIEL